MKREVRAPTELAKRPLLAGRYRYVKELGRGALGRVFLAQDTHEGDALRAIKAVPPRDAAWLVAEFEALRQIKHPHIARVFELLRVDVESEARFHLPRGSAWLVEAYVEGVDLETYARARAEEGSMSIWVARMGAQLASALAAVHASGLAHGDVKTENILCDVAGDNLTLIDFSLARPFGRVPGAAGTPLYMAPESFLGEASERTDIFAMGVALERLGGGLDPSLAALLSRMRASDPRDRPAAAASLEVEFDALARAKGAAASRPKRGEGDVAPRANPARFSALPRVGVEAVASEGCDRLHNVGVVVVSGARGSGCTTVAREIALRFQSHCRANGGVVPTFVSRSTLPEVVPTYPTLVHVEHGDMASALRLRDASIIAGVPVYVILEDHGTDARVGAASVQVTALESASVIALFQSAFPGLSLPSAAWFRRAEQKTGFLAGKLVAAFEAFDRLRARPDDEKSWDTWTWEGTDATSDLDRAAREMLLALSVAGGSLAAQVLAQAQPHAIANGVLLRLCRAGHLAFGEAGEYEISSALRARLLEGATQAERTRVAAHLISDAVSDENLAFLEREVGEHDKSKRSFLGVLRRLRNEGRVRRAIAVARDAAQFYPDEPELRFQLGDALRASGQYLEAFNALPTEPTGVCLWLRYELMRLLGRSVDPSTLLRAAERASGPSERLRILAARILLASGNAARACEIAASLERESHDASVRVRAAEVLLFEALARGDFRARAASVEGALQLAIVAKDPATLAQAHSLMATYAHHRRDYHAALLHADRALHFADLAGETHASAAFSMNLGLAALDAGDLARALPALRRSATTLFQLDAPDFPRALYNAANAAALVGNRNVARSLLDRLHASTSGRHDESLLVHTRLLASDLAAFDLAFAEAVRALGAEPTQANAAYWAWWSRRVSLAMQDSGADWESLVRAMPLTDEPEDSGGVDVDRAIVRAGRRALSADAGLALPAFLELRHEFEAQPFEDRLRAANFGWQLSQRVSDTNAAALFAREMRVCLEAAMAPLSEDDQAYFRSCKLYRRFLATPLIERHAAGHVASGASRWREVATLAQNLLEADRVDGALDDVLKSALALTAAERAFIIELDADGRTTHVAARSVLLGKAEPHTYSRSVVGRVHRTGHSEASLDALSDALMLSTASAHALLLRSVAAVAVQLGESRFGVLYVDDRLRPSAFNAEELEMLEHLAALASRALGTLERKQIERATQRKLELAETRLSTLVQAQGIELRELRRTDRSEDGRAHAGIVVASASMRRVLELVERVASADVPVLITGESGTGKELIARAIHASSARSKGPFVSENSGALPEALVESALFGHVRGAFTGADRNRAGLFELADGGTLLLDEIGELGAATQVKFLRALQSGEIRALGSEQVRHTDVRVIAATNRNLEERIATGQFREDLYYRLAVVTLHIPPLRERVEDVGPLVAHFIERHSNGRTVRIEPAALAALQRFAWPGNVRQLENEVRRALVLCRDVLRAEHLSDSVRGRGEVVAPASLDVRSQTDALERRLISEALRTSAGNQTKAAKLLGVSRFGLQKMMKRLGIDADGEK